MIRASLILILCVILSACGAQPARVLSPPSPCPAWPALPLSLWVEPDAAEYAGVFAVGSTAWGDALGHPAFVAADSASADVVVVSGEYAGVVGARAWHECQDGHVLTTIVMHQPYEVGASHVLAQHELGHALGVGHSTDPASVMYPRTSHLMGEWGPFQRITEMDARLVGALPRRTP